MIFSALGIDIAKNKFDIAIKMKNKYKHKIFANETSGFEGLIQWLKDNKINEIHACMEATGIYGNKLATYLHEKNYRVSVVNPAKIKAFSQSVLNRNKTDKADAQIIALYCEKMEPTQWKPEKQSKIKLKELVKHKENLEEQLNKEIVRLSNAEGEQVKKSIKKIINAIKEEIKVIDGIIKEEIKSDTEMTEQIKYLESIPGIGTKSAVCLLTKLPEITNFKHAKQLEAFVGLNPKQKQSGNYRGATPISRIGSNEIRKALYFPAMVAIKYNPRLKEFSQRMSEKGKAKKEIICAAMRKLIRIIFGILRTKKMFEVNAIV
jgi:transposase